MQFKFTPEDIKELDGIKARVEANSRQMDEIVDSIISDYTKDLDNYVDFIRGLLADGQNPPTDVELDDFVMNLSTYIYFASGMCERLGIRDDIAEAVYREMYHTVRSNIDEGTVADKNSLAELEAQKENVVAICYARAYKTVKAKVEAAQELLSSCKKVLSRRLANMELTRMGGSGR